MEAIVAHAMTRSGRADVAALVSTSRETPDGLGDYFASCLSAAAAQNEKSDAIEADIAATSHEAARRGSLVGWRCARPEKVYHVATDTSWEHIECHGLTPAQGERSSSAGEREPKVFLFGSRQDVEDALGNWLGEEFEDHEGDLVIIETDTPNDAEPTFPDADASWEWSTASAIPAAALRVVGRC